MPSFCNSSTVYLNIQLHHGHLGSFGPSTAQCQAASEVGRLEGGTFRSRPGAVDLDLDGRLTGWRLNR